MRIYIYIYIYICIYIFQIHYFHYWPITQQQKMQPLHKIYQLVVSMAHVSAGQLLRRSRRGHGKPADTLVSSVPGRLVEFWSLTVLHSTSQRCWPCQCQGPWHVWQECQCTCIKHLTCYRVKSLTHPHPTDQSGCPSAPWDQRCWKQQSAPSGLLHSAARHHEDVSHNDANWQIPQQPTI